MQSDGQIVISTKLDTKQLETQLKQQEKQLQKYQQEADRLATVKSKEDENLSKYYEEKKMIEEFTDKALEYAQTEKEVAEKLELEKEQLKQLDEAYGSQLDKIKEIDNALEENARNQAIMRGEIQKTNQEISQAKGIAGLKTDLQEVGKETGKVIKKLGKWVLALFGIRAMYGFIRNSVNILTENDEQLKADIEFMKTALAYSIEPIIKQVVEWLKILFQYIAYIIKLWTGNDIIAKANKNLKTTSKRLKEIKKQLAGFDEANILSDTSGGAGVGGGIKGIEAMTPQDAENFWVGIYDWINKVRQKIQDYQDEIKSIITNNQAFKKAYGIWSDFVQGVGRIWQGLVDRFAGAWDTIVGIVKFFVDIITGNFDELGEDIKLMFSGWVTMWKGQIELTWGMIQAVVGLIKGLLSLALQWVYSTILSPLLNQIKNFVNTIKSWFTGLWNSISNSINNIWNKITNGFSMIKSGAKTLINYMIDGINKFINGMNKIQWDVPSWVPIIGGQKWGVNIPNIPRLAQGGIVEAPRGVMMGSYIAGESGREGVLPLTNPTTMQELGAEIGKWVNISIDNKMVVDGRVLATATNNQINKENFLLNR